MPEQPQPGPEFLKGKYGDDPEFQRVVRKSAQKEGAQDEGEQITTYLERLDRIARYQTPAGVKTREGQNPTEGPDPDHGLRQLKRILYKKHVVKPEQIPDDYIKEVLLGNFAEQSGYERYDLRNPDVREQVLTQFAQRTGSELASLQISPEQRAEVERQTIEDQQSSLDQWLDYLTSPEADNYPREFRYWAMAEVLQCGPQDPDRKRYKERRPDTTASFPELNQQALALVLDELARKYAGRSSALAATLEPASWQGYRQRLQHEQFSSLYGWALDHVNRLELPKEQLAVIEGEWEPFTKKKGAKALTEKLQGYNTGWCIAGEGTAQSYLEHSEILVYFSQDAYGENKIPRAAIVTDGQRITEVRGIINTKEAKQHLDDYITPTVRRQLEGMKGGKDWLDVMDDQRQLATIHLKSLKNKPLTRDDLVFLYELDRPIKYSGYGQDPRIAELRATRNPDEDAPVVFGCTKEQIVHNPDHNNRLGNNISADTKAYVGKLEPGIFDKIAQFNIEHVYMERFPEGKISFERLEVGGKTVEQYKQALREGRYKVYQHAEQMLDNPAFVATLVDPETGQLKAPEQHTFVRLTVNDLFSGNVGSRGYVTTTGLFAKARDLGLELCPPATGPDYRLAHPNQSMGDYVNIGMEPIAVADGNPIVFVVGHDGNGRWLGRRRAVLDYEWSPGYQFLFRLRKSVQTLGVTEPLKA